MNKVIERLASDMSTWEGQLRQISAWVDQAEITKDPDDFRYVRLQIKSVLDDLENAGKFIQAQKAAALTADVDALFDGDQGVLPGDPLETRLDVLRADRYRPGEDNPG